MVSKINYNTLKVGMILKISPGYHEKKPKIGSSINRSWDYYKNRFEIQ